MTLLNSQALPHHIVCVDREMFSFKGGEIEFERLYHTTAENAEQAQIKVNKFLVENFDMEEFPEFLFVNLSAFDDYKEPKDDAEHMKIYNLIKSYGDSIESFPISEGVISFDEENNTAYPNSAYAVSEQTYLEMTKINPFIEVQ